MPNSAKDKGYVGFKAALVPAGAPYDPAGKTGDPDDSARYVAQPGVNFFRPWLASGGLAYQFPMGLEGFSLTVDPMLGTHKYIGDNKAVVEVLHAGEEHFTMTGNFLGLSAADNLKALRKVVYAPSPDTGKLLWLPDIYDYVERVQVVRFESARAQDARGDDMTYSIEFIRLGDTAVQIDPEPALPSSVGTPTKPSTRSIKVDATHNTLRKIATWKLGNATKWKAVYNLNTKWFTSRKIPLASAPTYRIPLGTVVYF